MQVTVFKEFKGKFLTSKFFEEFKDKWEAWILLNIPDFLNKCLKIKHIQNTIISNKSMGYTVIHSKRILQLN